MYSSTLEYKQATRAVRATDEQRDMLMLSYGASPSPSKGELALLSFRTNLDMEWINRWFMRQRAAERRRTAPPKPPKSVIDLTVKREQVDLQVDVCASGTTTTPTDVQPALPAKEEEEEAEDSSSTHIASSPTRYSMTSSLPPSSSPPSSPAPHTVKPSAPYRDAAAIPTLRLFRGLPYEDPRARHPNASDVGEGASNLPAQTYTPASVPVSAYMRGVSAAIPVSATLSTSRPAASAHVLIAPKPTRQPLLNPYLPRGPTSRPLLPVSALPGPSSWDEYLSARARVVQQEHPVTSGKADAPATPASKTAATVDSPRTTQSIEPETPNVKEMLPLLSDLERETDVAKIALLLAQLRRLGLQW